MVVNLGCEKLTVEKMPDPEDITPENVIVLQEKADLVEVQVSVNL